VGLVAQGKPVARRGRKTRGLSQTAQLPTSIHLYQDKEVLYDAELRLRWLWTAPAALILQTVIVTVAPGGSESLHAAAHIVSYALVGAFLWANRHVAGAKVIALGALSNTLAIVANGGVMPASRTAQHLAGLTEGGGFQNSAAVSHPILLWLGDIIPVPGPLPNVMSVGDCIIFAGLLVLLHRQCRPRATLQPA
jgi:Family of unknown function (DUF5317)